VLIGENRTFDHTFATYQPKYGQTVSDLLSKGIIHANGSPGTNAVIATQDFVKRWEFCHEVLCAACWKW